MERAVAIGNHTVLGLARMTIERSAGHFPTKPIVPSIELCKPMAQAGIVLVILRAQAQETPIAIGSGKSRARAKDLIAAPPSPMRDEGVFLASRSFFSCAA